MRVLFLYDYEKNANRKAPTDWGRIGAAPYSSGGSAGPI